MLGLIAVMAVLGQVPQHRLFEQPNLRRPNGQAAPFFSFAPANGAGMTAACACTAPTGTQGEALTFSRASSGTCLKGPTVTGIASGDMVTCTTDQPRVMPGGSGAYPLGLLVEEGRTNIMLRSQEFDNAVWSKEAGVTVVADSANCPAAPDGTQTMDLVAFGGASGAGIFQIATITNNNTVTHTVFLVQKNGGAACTLGVKDSASGATTTTVVLTSSLQRAEISETAAGTSAGLYVREVTAGDCVDACLWGGQTEQGALFSTSYIATTSIAVARAGELADVAVTFGAGTTGFSMAGTAVLEGLPSNPVILGCVGDRAPGVAAGSITYACPDSLSAVFRGNTTASSTNVYSTGLAVTTASRRFVEFFTTGGVHNGCVDGVCAAGDTGKTWTAPAWLRWRLGNYDINHNNSDGVLKNLCLDPASGACR